MAELTGPIQVRQLPRPIGKSRTPALARLKLAIAAERNSREQLNSCCFWFDECAQVDPEAWRKLKKPEYIFGNPATD